MNRKQLQERASQYVGGPDDVRILGDAEIVPDEHIRAAFAKHGMPEKLAQYWIDQLYGWGYEPAEMIEMAPAIVERSRQFAALGAEKFAEERWITIGAEKGDEDGKGRKGRKVKIDEDGNIVGGSVPQEWRGKDVSNPATYGDKRYTVGGDDEVLPTKEQQENEARKAREARAAEREERSNEPTRKVYTDEEVDDIMAGVFGDEDTADTETPVQAYESILGRGPTPEERDRIGAAAEKMAEHADNPAAYWGSAEQPYWKPGPNPTVDAVITRDGPNGKQVLMIQRGPNGAEANKWALPGGFHDSAGGARGEWWKPGKESAEDAALRELAEETGLDASAIRDRMKHVGSFDTHGRDPRDNDYAWAVSNAYSLHLDGDLANAAVAGMDDAQDAQWIDVADLDGMETAFDHGDILQKAGVTDDPLGGVPAPDQGIQATTGVGGAARSASQALASGERVPLSSIRGDFKPGMLQDVIREGILSGQLDAFEDRSSRGSASTVWFGDKGIESVKAKPGADLQGLADRAQQKYQQKYEATKDKVREMIASGDRVRLADVARALRGPGGGFRDAVEDMAEQGEIELIEKTEGLNRSMQFPDAYVWSRIGGAFDQIERKR